MGPIPNIVSGTAVVRGAFHDRFQNSIAEIIPTIIVDITTRTVGKL
jgi:hypothetical protein